MADSLYTASATASDGRIRSADTHLDLPFGAPKDLGGSGEGTDPEQIIAASFASCFAQALQVAATEQAADASQATVTAQVDLTRDEPGFAIAVALQVSLPGLDDAARDRVLSAAQQICPITKAVRGNIDYTVTAA